MSSPTREASATPVPDEMTERELLLAYIAASSPSHDDEVWLYEILSDLRMSVDTFEAAAQDSLAKWRERSKR